MKIDAFLFLLNDILKVLFRAFRNMSPEERSENVARLESTVNMTIREEKEKDVSTGSRA